MDATGKHRDGRVHRHVRRPARKRAHRPSRRRSVSGWLVLAGSVLLLLPGCNRFSWGPEGMRMAVGATAPARPPFDVEEALVLRPQDRPPEAVDRAPLQRQFSSAIAAGLLPASGERALVAWLLINQEGVVADVRVEQESGDPNFDEAFREGISLSLFRPAERMAESSPANPPPADPPCAEPPCPELVSVWMEYPYAISWSGREPRGSDGSVSGDRG